MVLVEARTKLFKSHIIFLERIFHRPGREGREALNYNVSLFPPGNGRGEFLGDTRGEAEVSIRTCL
jgi:hypothetical protein